MHLLIFGFGYTTRRLAARLSAAGWRITAAGRVDGDGIHRLDGPIVAAVIGEASHILSSVPPEPDGDPVLAHHAGQLAVAPASWIGYLSSTGVYGDAGGGWVDEAAPLGGRRVDRVAADRAWQALRPDVRVFRLPGIYGPGRSALDQLRAGRAHRVDVPGQRFSRVHVDDIGAAVIASFDRGGGGAYNLGDDEPASGRAVVEYAADLLGLPYPPLIAPDDAALSPMARGFYSESRVIATGKARRELGFRPAFPDFRAGLRACLQEPADHPAR